MYACHRTHHQRRKRTGTGAIIAGRKFIITSRTGTSGTATATGYNSNYVQMFDSIGIIEPYASHNRALAGVGKVTSKKIWGAFN